MAAIAGSNVAAFKFTGLSVSDRFGASSDQRTGHLHQWSPIRIGEGLGQLKPCSGLQCGSKTSSASAGS